MRSGILKFTVATSLVVAAATAASSDFPGSDGIQLTLKVMTRYCFKDKALLGKTIELAKADGLRPLIVAEDDELLRPEANHDSFSAWEIRLATGRTYKLVIARLLEQSWLSEVDPELADAEVTSCSVLFSGEESSVELSKALETVLKGPPNSTTESDWGIFEHWIGGADDLVLITHQRALPGGSGGSLNLAVARK